MQTKPTATARPTIRVRKSTWATLRRLAEAQDKTVVAVCDAAVTEYAKRHRPAARQPRRVETPTA